MIYYKVPQDVEADDKLIGPFSFRQFIYLIIVAVGIALAWFMGQIFIGLILIPMPFIVFFGALALPLRKDQPMEIYLTALVRFFFKPRIRLWQPEGQVNLVTIVAPHVNEQQLTKGYGADEANRRLSYLADVIDTQGWASRGVSGAALANLNDTITAEASTVDDMLDASVGIGRQFDSLIEEQDAIRKRQTTERFQAAAHQPEPTVAPPPLQSTDPLAVQLTLPPAQAPTFNPYPAAMHQHVVAPSQHTQITPEPASGPVQELPQSIQAQDTSAIQPDQPQQNASGDQPSPDIMRLANNRDLSISAIAREAHRLEDSEEVVISLR